jgi:hypothetical protein
MFTRNTAAVLVLVVLLLAGTSGCGGRPDPERYGEVLTRVPPELNRPFPLPELEEPAESPLPGPKTPEPDAAESPK